MTGAPALVEEAPEPTSEPGAFEVTIPEGVATVAPSDFSLLSHDHPYARALRVDCLGFDQETYRIGPGAPFPKPVCATFARRTGPIEAGTLLPRDVTSWLVANGDPEWVRTHEGIYRWLDEDPAFAPGGDGVATRELVCHNGHGFDLPVEALHIPSLISAIFRALYRGQVRDTMTREKLLNLAVAGVVDYYFTPDGQARDVSYRLAALVLKWLRIDRNAQKGADAEGKRTREDTWQLNFNTLDGLPRSQYPVDASDYAIHDAVDALRVKEEQDHFAWRYFGSRGARGHDGGPFDVFRTEALHVGAMFCLSLGTYEGFGVDAAVVEDMDQKVATALRPEQTHLLFESDLMSRPEPARPYVNNTKHKAGGEPCTCAAPTHEPGTLKWKHPEPVHLSKKKLLELVVKTWAANRLCDEDDCPKRGGECERHGLGPLKRTDPSKTFPDGQISCDGEVIADLAPFDLPDQGGTGVLAQYDHYTIVGKLQTLEIPRLREALAHGGVIHPNFDEFKKTGRISSRRSKFYPSINIQQIPRGVVVDELDAQSKPVMLTVKNKDGTEKKVKKTIKIEPRHAYIPRRPGWVLISIDYSFIELVTLAQTTKRVIGYSVLLDKINKGMDPHAFLGAQMAYAIDADFAECCRIQGKNEPDDVYRLFVQLKAGSDEEKAFYKTWRNFAKPTGLGFPGGLGARTFISYAKKLYGITIKSIEQAKQFKAIWINAFPENGDYLNRYVRDHLRDEIHSDGERERFAYFSPLGAYRARCSFTEVANGFALQTPAAEGMKLAYFNLQRACWDPDMKSCLYGCRGLAAVHDELLLSVPKDQYLHERAFEASRIWIAGMNQVCDEALVKADPAAMTRWDKGAEMVLGPDERLRVWSPDEKYKMDDKERLRSAS